MRTLTSLALAVSLGWTSGCHPSGALPPPASILPLQTLRLYETGVGYFERAGAVGRTTALPVPAGHLDDALKTLVVLSKDGRAFVHGVAFASSVSRGMARSLAGLPLEADRPISYADILASLKGTRVEIATRGGTFHGRVVDVLATADKLEAKPDGTKSDAPPERGPAELTVLLLTDTAAIRRVSTEEITSVRPTDPAFATRLGSALDALSSRAAQTDRLLRVLGDGGAIRLGYVAETPIWRSTYRLVLGATAASTTLEGWALVHNDTDEDWEGVRTELVNGRPDSFLFPLAAPRYARRELVTPAHDAATVPQLAGQTVDTLWGDRIDDAFGAGGLGLTGVGEGGGGRGEGIGLGSVGTVGHGYGMGSSDGKSTLLEVGNLAKVAEASGVESGALFTYTLARPLDLRARGSALVPFLQRATDAEAITWIDKEPGAEPRSAVRFVNSTPQTLPSGPISFFGDGGFEGESSLDRLKPGERRFLTFGADLDLTNETGQSVVIETPKRLTFTRPATLDEHYLRASRWSYTLENRGGKARTVYAALTLSENATVTGADATDFDPTTRTPVAVFHVPARQKLERVLSAVEGLSRSVGLDAITADRLAELAGNPGLPAADRSVANEAAARQRAVEELQATTAKTTAESAQVSKDLERLREDLKALGGDKGLAANNPFVARILGAEDRLVQLRKKQEALAVEATKRKAAVRVALERLEGG